MNILYFLGQFPKLSESFVLNEIYELDRRGHQVAVCALNKPTESVSHREYDELDISVHWIETPQYRDVTTLCSTTLLHPGVIKSALHPGSPKHHAANLYRAKRCIEFVECLPFDLDHVHTHFAKGSNFGAAYVSAYYDVPFTLTTHATDLYRRPLGRYKPYLLRAVNRLVTISEYNRSYIREHFVDDTPIDIVHAGIRPDKFRPSGDPQDGRILTVSRLVEKKGIRYAIEAVAEVAKHVPDVDYHIVGSGPLQDDLEALVAEHDLHTNVNFLDTVSDDRLLTEYNEARCFLLPCVVAESGNRDGIPVALMEAMAMKIPPVSTTVSGIPELIEDDWNGLLVEPRDPDLIADALLTMIRNDSRWRDYRDRTRPQIVDEFNISREVEKLETTFERCVQ
ncbi:glycosyltransferase [Haloplanus natans]|uniref:glycosyltransferase n=1 Tax=Haloplanus natans TaxID=376171 RepID=UPI000677BF6D|nr:glycosyltransferase [Haloplanus natans]